MKKIIIAFLFVLCLCSCSSFDQSVWLAEPEKRSDMIGSLTSKYKLKGMTEREVIDLLGEPSQKVSDPSRQFLYNAGPAGLFGIKVQVFQLIFDENGKVESYDIIYK